MESKNLTPMLLLNRPVAPLAGAILGTDPQRLVGESPLRVAPPQLEIPLSPAQRRVWSAELAEPGTPAQSIGRALTLKGPLDHAALERALVEIIHRHDVLRTVCRPTDPPTQEVQPPAPWPLPRHDLTHLAPLERRRVASNLMAMDIARPFDLTTGHLLRAKLIRLENEEHILLLMFHRMIMDPPSLEILFDEFAALYAAFSAGRPAPGASPAIQFGDVAFQQASLHGSAPERSWSADISPAAVQSYKIDYPLLEKLRTFSTATGTSLEATLLAAFKLLLHHWTGETELQVASSDVERRPSEARNLIGCFTDELALNVRMSPGETFRSIVEGVRQNLRDASDTLPTADHPLSFDARFERVDSLRAFRFGDAVATPKIIFPPVARFDLSLLVAEQADEVACFLEYKTSVLTTLQAARMLEQYDRLLELAMASPETPVQRFLAELEPL